jgi:hypothetical protein
MKTWKSLGYLGLVPFIICLIVVESHPHNLLFNSQQVFHFYSAIILCFLAGTLWKKDNQASQSNPLIVSNLLCLYAFSCLFLPLYYALIFLPMGYLSLLIAEYVLCNKQQHSFTTSYFVMRLVLTLFVSLLHMIALISWF